jgi:hypothetical protein
MHVRTPAHTHNKAVLVGFVAFMWSMCGAALPGMADCWELTPVSDHSPVGRAYCTFYLEVVTTWLTWMLGTFVVKYLSMKAYYKKRGEKFRLFSTAAGTELLSLPHHGEKHHIERCTPHKQ